MFKSLLSLLAFSSLAIAAVVPDSLEKRQSSESTNWQYSCSSAAPPSNFKAFDLGGCNTQLAFTKDRYVGIQWEFQATYRDGSTAVHRPFQDYNNFGVSDTFYPYLGNNFITKRPGTSSAFTAVHEFSNVCKNGQAPVSWRFYTTSANSACSSASYRYTTGQIQSVGNVSRPPKVSPSLRRINDNGDFEVSWSPVNGAAAYSVIVEYPTGTDEVGDPYRNVRGERVQASNVKIVGTQIDERS